MIMSTVKHNASELTSVIDSRKKPALGEYYLSTLVKHTISHFMESTGVSIHGFQHDPTGVVEKRTREQTGRWNLGGVNIEIFDHALVASCHIASAAYSHVPIDLQVNISLYTLLTICIDDYLIPNTALEEFMERMYSGSAQLHPLLDHAVEILRDMRRFFLPHAAKLIARSFIDFANATALDAELTDITLSPAALAYVTSKRLSHGICDAFACFIWDASAFPKVSTYLQAVPETALLLAYVNDIFSFYKEEIAHEASTFVHERAVVTEKDVPLALMDTVNEAIAALHKARVILTGDKERQALESFIAGYITYHRRSPRYRLDEVFGDQDL